MEHTSPNQLRPVYVSSAQKGYNFRRRGHKTLFKSADDLIGYQNIVWNHLKDTGMDSIAYLRDPTDGTKMTNVVKAHARYTVQSAKALHLRVKLSYLTVFLNILFHIFCKTYGEMKFYTQCILQITYFVLNYCF